MSEIRLTSDITIRQISSSGGDSMVAAAAKVSTSGEDVLTELETGSCEDREGLIRYLMKMRNGTPFESSSMTFFVHAPILVWREWHRHRIGFSYNEESGRYKILEPVFYVPDRERPMMKVDGWKPGRPKFLTLDEHFGQEETYGGNGYPSESNRMLKAQASYTAVCANLRDSYILSYNMYLSNLRLGIDPGLAMDCLPVGIYSSCWVTANPRSLMSFLSLCTHEPSAAYPSYPLWEIELAARACEKIFAEGWPITYQAFVDFGRVAP